MKKIVILILNLLTIPLLASLDCMTNSKELREAFDTKKWESAQCNCPCKDIKAGKCIICCHLQQAHPFTIIKQKNRQSAYAKKILLPQSLEQVKKNFVLIHRQRIAEIE